MSLVVVSGTTLFADLQSTAYVTEAPVSLGAAAPFSVLAGTTVTNTGPSVIGMD
ncbi:MAG: hypothetical protein JWN52_2170, partial [Actinomycetia bacterium]|nr:hypothetical protein [Actinomycetes bacterium]